MKAPEDETHLVYSRKTTMYMYDSRQQTKANTWPSGVSGVGGDMGQIGSTSTSTVQIDYNYLAGFQI